MSKHRQNRRPARPRLQAGGGRGPRGGGSNAVWIYGFHPVAAALENPLRTPLRIVATRQGMERIRTAFPDSPVATEIKDTAGVAALLPDGAVHQGIALKCDPLPERFIEDVLREDDARSVIVVLDQVTDPHNIGAILRTAAVFGADALIMQDRNAPPETGVLAKAASGALELVPLVRTGNLARTLETAKKAGYWVVGLDGDVEAELSADQDHGRTVLVLGAEGQGLRRLTAETCDLLVKIPMKPNTVGSLNVSNAAAIALYELTRGTP